MEIDLKDILRKLEEMSQNNPLYKEERGKKEKNFIEVCQVCRKIVNVFGRPDLNNPDIREILCLDCIGIILEVDRPQNNEAKFLLKSSENNRCHNCNKVFSGSVYAKKTNWSLCKECSHESIERIFSLKTKIKEKSKYLV